jgi:hypothetical protein
MALVEKEVNALWFTAIQGEMVMNYKYNTNLGNYNPFTRFREIFPEAPKKKVDCLLFVFNLCLENDIKPSILLEKVMIEIDW